MATERAAKTERDFKVACFTHRRYGRKPQVAAYTGDYATHWKGYCPHFVRAANGTEAKRIAIEQHRANCIPKEDPTHAE